MSEALNILIILLLPFLTVLIIFALKYGSAVYQARARIAADTAYRELAQNAVNAQSQVASSVTAMQAELAQIASRLATVTKILQEVE